MLEVKISTLLGLIGILWVDKTPFILDLIYASLDQLIQNQACILPEFDD